MKMFLVLLTIIFFSSDPVDIAKSNKLKKEAQASFEKGDYESAIKKYSIMIDSMKMTEDALYLNRAHSYYLLGDTINAKPDYQNATASNSKELRSLAHQQLGVMAKDKNLLTQSLAHLKSALKNDPTNEDARFDYEVVKKLAKEQEEQQQDQENQDGEDQQDQEENQENEQQDQEQENNQEEGEQNEQDQQNQGEEEQDQEGEKENEQQEGEEQKEGEEQQQQEGEESEEDGQENKEQPQPSTQEKLEEMNISEEKARMILEAMQNNEIQYIQQQRRKPTKPQDTGKPDW